MNSIISLVSRNDRLLPGWGFPPVDTIARSDNPLRGALMWLEDADGRNQLVRWYAGVIRSCPAVWRSLPGDSGYPPSMVFKSAVESPSLSFCRCPYDGTMKISGTAGPGLRSLSGHITIGGGEAILELGGKTFDMDPVLHADSMRYALTWPSGLGIKAGLVSLVEGRHAVAIRPTGFSAGEIAASLVAHHALIASAGLLDEYIQHPRAEDKLAVAWLAVHTLETR